MNKLFTFLESDENFARVVKWSNVVTGAVAVYMSVVFLITFLNK
ncbi:putative membrane protein [Paraburkholderia caffeinilytica]|jgi:hypothetical protein|nr:hypothetical protein [Paraburkholderia caffeinilytica]AXL53607.1 putative membrane protein [Paraburkholderia caffeinilytica]CAB3780543.1 hypothetical protein LMG28690_00977 [Paraburkholderia caffeinilytica]